MAEFVLSELARLVDGEVDGDGSVVVRGVAGIAEASEGDLSFVHSPKYLHAISRCKASALIVARDLETDFRPVIRTANPYQAFARAIGIIVGEIARPEPGIHSTASVAGSARIGEGVSIGAHVVVDEGASIGRGTVLCPGVYVGPVCHVGENCLIYPNVTINSVSVLGDNVILHSGTIIGASGSAVSRGKGADDDVPRAILEDDIEMGANCTVSLGRPATVIGRGTKVDNLVNIGSGARVEEECIIVAQAQVGDGSVVGRRATVAGQVTVRDGVHIGANSMVAAKSVVADDVPENSIVSGSPARPHDEDMRLEAYTKRLPQLFSRIQSMETRLRGQ